ncbi:MAG: NAD(P)-dependent oxidoreductase [Planctomycetota bacterium]
MEATGKTIGLVGVGLMGAALAERLLAGGFRVLGFDIAPARLAALRSLGGEGAGSAREVFERARRVVLSLPASDAVRSVLSEAEGALRPEHLVVDTTTGDPRAAEERGRELERSGAAYLEAPISGNSDEVRRGEVLVLAGGPEAAYEACRDIFATFARRTWRIGAWGAASRVKLTTNLVLGLHRAALAEALSFARALGLDPELALAVLREGPAYSRVMDAKGRKMLDRDFAPQARLSQHLKDVRLILEAGREAGARLPLSELHRRLLEQAERAGLGALDNSAIAEVFRLRVEGDRGGE